MQTDLDRALKSRKEPTFVLPEAPVKTLGRCAIEIGARPDDTSTRVLAEFQRRNGGGWRTSPSSFSKFSGALRNVLEPTDGPLDAPLVSLGDDEARSRAIAFVVKNYDLFGLVPSDLHGATVRVSPQRDDGTMVSREVELRGTAAQPGYEAFDSLARRWRWTIHLGRDGQIRAATAPDDLLPSFHLCTDAKLSPGDPKLVAGVIGYQLSYSSIGGQRIDAGAVTAADIGDKTLTIVRQGTRESVTLRLAYAILVHRGGLGWMFVVDADTGQILAVDQRFRT